MSVWDHREEVKRLVDSPNGTKVWFKWSNKSNVWSLLDGYPIWGKDIIYIVDDKHSELRKEWIDKGKPPVQMWDYTFDEWVNVDCEQEWNLDTKYRIKPSEWDTPEGEDPIAYHSKRLDPEWEADWSDINQRKYTISHLPNNNVYKYIHYLYHLVLGAVYMSEKAAKQIVEALNSGDLLLEN